MTPFLADYFLAALLMSLAWSLRGQFGHLKGALIPGAIAALVATFLLRSDAARGAFPRAILLGAIGFSAGGHIGYGKFIKRIFIYATLPWDDPVWTLLLMDFFCIFLIGAVWGGLGLTFLGFGISEKPANKQDLAVLAFLLFAWIFLLGILNLEMWDLFLFALGLAILHLYNLLLKKSRVISFLGLAGIFGFGLGFLAAVALLYLGRKGFWGPVWPWWSLRDQILGALGGASLACAVRKIRGEGLIPSRAPSLDARIGFVFLAVILPAIHWIHVLRYWWLHPDAGLDRWMFGWWVIVPAAIFIFLGIFLKRLDAVLIEIYTFDRMLANLSLFCAWFLSILAIAKQTLLLGWGRWEPAFSLFILYSLILTLLVPFIYGQND